MRAIFSILAGFLIIGSATAAELVVVAESAKSGAGSQLALDVASDGDVSAMQFAVKLPGKVRGVNTAKCLSELPKSHTGLCQANIEKGMVAVVVWSNENTALPKGMVPIGQIEVDLAGGASTRGLEVVDLYMSGADSRPVASTSTVSGNAASRARPTDKR